MRELLTETSCKPSNSAPSELVAMSARLGRDLDLVQGGGGNTSMKFGEDFWIKASGTWLAHADTRDIFICLPLQGTRDAIMGDDPDRQMAAINAHRRFRPSIETSLHALLAQPVVAHVHSVNTIAWAVQHDAPQRLEKALAGISWAWVPYRRPGLPLTRAISEVLSAVTTPPNVLILGNHGLVVAGPDCAQTEARLHEVEARLSIAPRPALPAQRQPLDHINDCDWRVSDDPLHHAIATDPGLCDIAQRGALYPDHVVFLGVRACVVPPGLGLRAALAQHHVDTMPPPLYAIVPGSGILISPDASDGAIAMLDCLARVGLRCEGCDSLRFLTSEEASELTHWEAELYRRNLSKTPSAIDNETDRT